MWRLWALVCPMDTNRFIHPHIKHRESAKEWAKKWCYLKGNYLPLSLTFSWCSYLNVKDWSLIFLLCSRLLAARVWGFSCVQKDADFGQRDPGPVQTDYGAGSCLTQLRSTQRPVKAHHRLTLLRSIPYRLLTGCVSATHSSFSHSLKQKKAKRKNRREWACSFCPFTSYLLQYKGSEIESCVSVMWGVMHFFHKILKTVYNSEATPHTVGEHLHSLISSSCNQGYFANVTSSCSNS